ncbi:helix-turn-helix domain-containing protein [Streptomyces pharetrae]|uniref:helix-turn-helix domain-containing protein n=1 Tax=Streptomyces pharetrae TaxID=291370 RepID=UPI003363AEDF
MTDTPGFLDRRDGLAQPLGHLRFLTADADPQRLLQAVRRAGQGTGRTSAHLVVAVVGAAPAGGPSGRAGRTAQPRGGHLAVWGAAHPPACGLPPGVPITACLVPCSALGPWAHISERLTPLRAAPDSPSGTVLGSLVTALAGSAARCPEPVARQLAGGITDLVVSLIAEHARDEASAPAGGPLLVQRIRTYVDRHLADPGLGPESIAAAHHISVRALHKLFAHEDVTVGRLIQRRRLEECAKDLLREETARLTVASVARGWGFANAAHFSRLFRTVYGMPPSRWRAGAAPPAPAGHLARRGAAESRATGGGTVRRDGERPLRRTHPPGPPGAVREPPARAARTRGPGSRRGGTGLPGAERSGPAPPLRGEQPRPAGTRPGAAASPGLTERARYLTERARWRRGAGPRPVRHLRS